MHKNRLLCSSETIEGLAAELEDFGEDIEYVKMGIYYLSIVLHNMCCQSDTTVSLQQYARRLTRSIAYQPFIFSCTIWCWSPSINGPSVNLLGRRLLTNDNTRVRISFRSECNCCSTSCARLSKATRNTWFAMVLRSSTRVRASFRVSALLEIAREFGFLNAL